MSKEIEDHRLFNQSSNQPFADVLAQHVSRRAVMRGGLGLAAASMLGFGGAAQALASNGAQKTPLTLAFEAVQGSRTDAVVVPEGYIAQVLVPWGTPLSAGDSWQPDQPMTAERQAASV
ncbi:twin-arginine translocation pathway signal, partial [Halomonas sp. TD01]